MRSINQLLQKNFWYKVNIGKHFLVQLKIIYCQFSGTEYDINCIGFIDQRMVRQEVLVCCKTWQESLCSAAASSPYNLIVKIVFI